MSETDVEVENLLRQLVPQVLGAVVRRFGSFDTAEDAVQEAMLAATTQWPSEGVPDNPKGWLITVAKTPSLVGSYPGSSLTLPRARPIPTTR